MIIIDGKKIASEILSEIAEEVKGLKKIPHLSAILVGNDGASETYVAGKIKACEKVGFKSSMFRFDENVSEKELLKKIDEINNNNDIDGLIVQLPLPKHISSEKVTQKILPQKDVDGFHPVNIGRVAKNLPAYISATPFGILQLLERYKIETSGKHCVVLGRSDIVGTPISILLSRNTYSGNCTVTLCHSKTKNLKEFSKSADILIVALGQAGFVTKDMVKEGAVVIDVGITRVKSDKTTSGYQLKGDVKFDEVSSKCSYITPVPGGVGAMTIVALLQNTLKAAKREIIF